MKMAAYKVSLNNKKVSFLPVCAYNWRHKKSSVCFTVSVNECFLKRIKRLFSLEGKETFLELDEIV